MPVKSIRRKNRDNKEQLLEGYYNFLTWGLYLDGDEEFDDMSHAFRIWKRYRDVILRDYEPGGKLYNAKSPGQRPHGYWLFEIKEKPASGYYEQTKRLIKLEGVSTQELDMIKQNPFMANLIAGKNKDVRKILSIKNVINLAQKRQDLEEI